MYLVSCIRIEEVHVNECGVTSEGLHRMLFWKCVEVNAELRVTGFVFVFHELFRYPVLCKPDTLNQVWMKMISKSHTKKEDLRPHRMYVLQKEDLRPHWMYVLQKEDLRPHRMYVLQSFCHNWILNARKTRKCSNYTHTHRQYHQRVQLT